MMKYSFFDFDGTLTRHDSFTGFIRHVRGWSGLLRVLLRSSVAILLWKMGLRSAVHAKLRMFREAFAGMPHEQFSAKGREYASKIERMLRPEVVAALRDAVRRGDRVAIVSASLGDWIRPWAEMQGVERVIATEPEVDHRGLLTGAFATPNCSHEQKVVRVLEAFPELAENRAACQVDAYGDSHGDDALLEFADNPTRIR